MVQVEFILTNGERVRRSANEGISLMQLACDSGVPGIVAECGGTANCGTCHVYLVSPHELPPPSTQEADILNYVSEERRSNSRLSCQIQLDEQLQGLVVEIPSTQV